MAAARSTLPPPREHLFLLGGLRMGGAEAAVRNLILALPQELRARSALLLLNDPQGPAQAGELGLPVWNLGAPSWPLAGLALRRYLKVRPARRIYANLTQCIIAAGLAMSRGGPELLPIIHSCGTWKQRPSRPIHHLRILMERWAVRRHAARVVYVSQTTRELHERLLGYPADKGVVIPNLLPDLPRLPAPPTPPLRLITVCRLEKVKGLDWVLASPEVGRALHDMSWTIVGDGPVLPELRACAASRPELVLAGARRDVPELLACHHAFLLPSRSEGLSVALLEAIRAGLPVLCTDVGSNREIVHDGQNGRLFPVGDGPALAAALNQLRDPATRGLWADSSRSLFEENYAPSVVLPRQLELMT